MVKQALFIFIFLFITACGSSTDEKVAEAILDAQISLGSGGCQDAIDTLEALGRQNSNAHYLKTLSSAYACRAGYSTVTFFASDLALTALPPPLGGMTLYSTSKNTVSAPLETDAKFEDLQTAINILLYAGGFATTKNPTTTERAKYFTSDEASEINSQLMYMEMVQLGKYMQYYGNGSTSGATAGQKGKGSGTNTCFTKYAAANAAVSGALVLLNGTCKVLTSSHAELDSATVSATSRKTRLCHGVILMNGMLDVLPAVLGSTTSGGLSSASGVETAIKGVKTTVVGIDNTTSTLMATMNQSVCEDNAQATIGNVETFFAGIMEYMFL